MFRRAVALAAVLLAGVLVVNPAYLSFWHTQYAHSVEPVARGEVPDEADVLAYESLSPNAQRAFQQATESGDPYVVYHERNAPSEFFYSTDFSRVGKGIYYVQYRSDYYRFSTWMDNTFPFVYWFYQILLAGFGLAVGAVGFRAYRGESAWLAVALVVLGVALLLGGPLTQFLAGASVWKDAVVVSAAIGGLSVLAPRIRDASGDW